MGMGLGGPRADYRQEILAAKLSTNDIAAKYNRTPGTVRKDRSRLLKANGNGGNGHGNGAASAAGPASLAVPHGGLPALPQPAAVDVTKLDIEAEIGKLIAGYTKIEDDLRANGPASIPGVLACMGERRKTLETLLKTRELGHALSQAQEPENWQEEALAWFDRLLGKAPPEMVPALLKLASEVDPP
jgi:hypothetical protein